MILTLKEQKGLEISDEEIIQKCQEESTRSAAFSLLVKKYQRKIYAIIRRMVLDHEDANDLSQEVFVRVWKNLDSFQQQSKLFTWMYKIATNLSINHLNSKKRRFFLPIGNTEAEMVSKIENAKDFTGDEIDKKLQLALLKLPDKQRLVFNMKYFEDLSYKEIAEIVGTSEGALKASYHLAVKKIEEIIKTSIE